MLVVRTGKMDFASMMAQGQIPSTHMRGGEKIEVCALATDGELAFTGSRGTEQSCRVAGGEEP